MSGRFTPTSLRTILAALGLTAILLYAPLVGWGLPHATAPDRIKTFATDELLPLEGLAEMRSTFVRAAPDRNFGYPWWHYFVIAAAQAPYMGALMLTGGLSEPSPTFPFGLRDPIRALEVLTIIGRMVSVLMGAGIVIASFFFARALFGHAAGVISAVLTMLSYPMFYYSRTGNPDVPAFFWTALGLAVLATMLTNGVTVRRAAWLGVFAALAVATKDQAVTIFVPLSLVLCLPRFNHAPGKPYQIAPIVAFVAVGLVAYLAGTAMLVDPERHVTHVKALFFDPARVTRSAIYYPPAPRTWAGTVGLVAEFGAGLASMMSWPVLLMSLAGLVIAVRRARWHLLWLIPFAMIFALLVRLPGIMVLRYVLPLTLFIDAFAALALTSIRSSRMRWAFMPLLVVLAGWQLGIGADLSFAQLRDTRYPAADWLRANYRDGDRIEYFGIADTLPSLEPGMITRRLQGRPHRVVEFGRGPEMVEYLVKEGPRFVIVVPDWTNRAADAQHSADCPPEVYAALMDGSAGYALAAYFPTPSLLPAPLRRPILDSPSVAPPVRIFARAVSAPQR